MNAILLLFVLGIAFLALELFVPGIAMGVIGAICFLGACALCFSNFGPWIGLLALLVSAALAGGTIYLEFYVLPRTRAGRKLFLHTSVTGVSQPPPATDAVVGKTGEALTVLAPSGYVMVEGKRYEAFSEDGMLTKGAKLKVTAIDHLTLRVAKL